MATKNVIDPLFLIVKYYISVLGVTDTSPHWGKVTAITNTNTGKSRVELSEITRDTAISLIRENGLVLAYQSKKDGRIYDTPDKAFQEKFKGLISVNI